MGADWFGRAGNFPARRDCPPDRLAVDGAGWLGSVTNPRLANVFQPVIQILASVPATALFPAFLLFFLSIPGGLNLAAVLLMLMGTQWYVLFNVTAGGVHPPGLEIYKRHAALEYPQPLAHAGAASAISLYCHGRNHSQWGSLECQHRGRICRLWW